MTMMVNNELRNTQRGSALVLILIGIVLFATISYVISQSLRVGTESGGDPIGTSERNTVVITDLMQFMDALKMRVFSMTNTDGVPEASLDFRNNIYLKANDTDITNNNNTTCGGVSTCSVFSPYAPTGPLPMIFTTAADADAQTAAAYPKNGHGWVREIALNSVGTPAPELIFVIQGIKPAICNLYNAKQGLTTNYTASTTLTSIGENGSTSVPADFSGFSTSNTFGAGATIFAGKKSFCAPSVADGVSHRLGIWHVLKVR